MSLITLVYKFTSHNKCYICTQIIYASNQSLCWVEEEKSQSEERKIQNQKIKEVVIWHNCRL